MKLLAIDTTGAYSSAAIYDGESIAIKYNRDNYSHLQKLIPTVDNIMKENGVTAADLDAIAVSRGPGSFTGIRIGLATVKGLAQIWNKPIVEVPTLASFAYREYSFIKSAENVLYCPVFDAKRHQVYAGAYRKNDRNPVIEDAACDLSEFTEKLEKIAEGKTVVFFGDGVSVYGETLSEFKGNFLFAPEEERFQDADGCARLGMELLSESITADCYTAQPEYLRAAEAERKLAEKIKADGLKFGTGNG